MLTGAKSFSGQPLYTITAICTLPVLIDAAPVQSRMGGDVKFEVEGAEYLQTHVFFASGLTHAQVQGYAPGATITIKGVPYIVAANGQGAFVDCQAGDRVTDERGFKFLCLAQAQYYTVLPNCQVRLALGRAWQ